MVETQELVRQDQSVIRYQEAHRFQPVMSLQEAIERKQIIAQAMNGLLKESPQGTADGDYGTVPGTKKPTLLQPGADKLNTLFGLVPTFEAVSKVEDWTGEFHNGEPFFHYEIKCRLWRGEFMAGEGDGSCNSWESKYRWRKGERVCPQCGASAILKSKQESGWFCWSKRDGCGAKFREDDPAIVDQAVGRVPNPDVCDQVNAIRKLANKRAKVAATLNALSAHEFFTQDLEEGAEEPEYTGPEKNPVAKGNAAEYEKRKAQKAAAAPPQQPAGDDFGDEPESVKAIWQQMGTKKSTIVQAFEWMFGKMDQLGAAHLYAEILDRYKMASPLDCVRAGIVATRHAARELILTIERLTAANTPPPKATPSKPDPDAITDDPDTWVPPNIGSKPQEVARG